MKGANNRKKAFEVVVGRRRLLFPYTKVTPRPANGDHVRTAYVDPQLAREGFTFVTLRTAENRGVCLRRPHGKSWG